MKYRRGCSYKTSKVRSEGWGPGFGRFWYTCPDVQLFRGKKCNLLKMSTFLGDDSIQSKKKFKRKKTKFDHNFLICYKIPV